MLRTPKRYSLHPYLCPTIPLGLTGFGLVMMMVMMTMIKMRMATQYQSWRSLPSGKWCQKEKNLSPDQINENTCKELMPCILEQKYKNDDKQSEELKVGFISDFVANNTHLTICSLKQYLMASQSYSKTFRIFNYKKCRQNGRRIAMIWRHLTPILSGSHQVDINLIIQSNTRSIAINVHSIEHLFYHQGYF